LSVLAEPDGVAPIFALAELSGGRQFAAASRSRVNSMNENLLRNLLREWISGEFTVIEITEFEDVFDSSGRPISHLDVYRRRHVHRLATLQKVAPDRVDLHHEHRAALIALSNLRPTDRLYHWSARSATREYFGVACTRGIVSFYYEAISQSDPNP
jgi:hypothetical protein